MNNNISQCFIAGVEVAVASAASLLSNPSLPRCFGDEQRYKRINQLSSFHKEEGRKGELILYEKKRFSLSNNI